MISVILVLCAIKSISMTSVLGDSGSYPGRNCWQMGTVFNSLSYKGF